MKKGRVTLASHVVEYDVVRSSRKTVALYVKPGGMVLVRAPWFVPAYILKGFVEAKAPWILRQREKLNTIRSEPAVQQYSDGSRIPFLGKNLTIRVSVEKRYSINSDGAELNICGPKIDSDAKIKALTEGWYLKEAKKYFMQRTHELGIQYNELLPLPKSVSIRKMKSRWGTCKSDGTICFNRDLIKKESDLIDSVIIHELCHLVHHNHGKEFYALLESIIPDYRSKRKELRRCS